MTDVTRTPNYPIDRTKTLRDPDPERLRAFEGLSLSDFERALPYRPGRKEVLEKLKYIIAGTSIHFDDNDGDFSKLDPVWETLRASRLFLSDAKGAYPHLWPLRITEQDYDAYRHAAQIRYWEKNRPKIKETFQLGLVKHPLVELCDELPILQLTTLKGLPSFDRLAKEILPMVPRIAQSKKLNVLYPGSGFHVAPLITALRLMDEGIIHEATYIYTEIKPEHFVTLAGILNRGIGNIFDRLAVEKNRVFQDEGFEQTILLHYKGHPIRLVFALNRSGKDWYRKEYLREADLIVIHDPSNGSFTSSFNLLAQILFDKRSLVPEKPQVVIMEGTRSHRPDDQFGFPSSMPQVLLPGTYGHCGGHFSVAEIEFCNFDSARAFPLHDPTLLSLAARHATAQKLSWTLFSPDQEVVPVWTSK